MNAQLVLVRVLLEDFMTDHYFIRRQPIHKPVLLGLHDIQQDPPEAWCVGCGIEVYDPGEIFCPDCRKEKENALQ